MMAVNGISSGNAAGLVALQSLQSAAPASRRDRDRDTETTEAGAAKAAETRAPLPADGRVGRSVDISA
jgi:hypothetical protein